MPLFSIVPLAKNVFSAYVGVTVQPKVPTHVQKQEGSRVHLERRDHPLLPNESGVAPSWPGKASLLQTNGVKNVLKELVVSEPTTAMGRLLQHMPSTPLLAPLQLASTLIANKLSIPPARTSLGGYLGEPEGATLLPGDSDVPRLKLKEEYLSDPSTPEITGRPEQRWRDANEGSLPVHLQPSDFIHLSAQDDFSSWLNHIHRGTENANRVLADTTDPKTLKDEWDQAFAQLRPGGPHKLSSALVKLEDAAGERKYLYAPQLEIMGAPLNVQHPHISGHADYGVLATHSSGVPQVIKIEINSNFPGQHYLENYWGNGDAMMQAVLQALEKDGIRPEHVLLRPSEFTDYKDWALQINENLIKPRGRATALEQIKFTNEINRRLRNVGGIGTLIDNGYAVVAIGEAPGQLPHLQVLLRRGDGVMPNSSAPNSSMPHPPRK